jgi:hypothetical protein
MAITYRGVTYRVNTEDELLRLLAALSTLQMLARRKAA